MILSSYIEMSWFLYDNFWYSNENIFWIMAIIYMHFFSSYLSPWINQTIWLIFFLNIFFNNYKKSRVHRPSLVPFLWFYKFWLDISFYMDKSLQRRENNHHIDHMLWLFHNHKRLQSFQFELTSSKNLNQFTATHQWNKKIFYYRRNQKLCQQKQTINSFDG